MVLQGRIDRKLFAPILHRRMASRQNAPSVCDTACLEGAVQGTRDTSDESSESSRTHLSTAGPGLERGTA